MPCSIPRLRFRGRMNYVVAVAHLLRFTVYHLFWVVDPGHHFTHSLRFATVG